MLIFSFDVTKKFNLKGDKKCPYEERGREASLIEAPNSLGSHATMQVSLLYVIA
jgi:hypothetical protein